MVGIWTIWQWCALLRLSHSCSQGIPLAGLAFHCLMAGSSVLPNTLARGNPEILAVQRIGAKPACLDSASRLLLAEPFFPPPVVIGCLGLLEELAAGGSQGRRA